VKNVTRIRIDAPPEAIWPWIAHPEGIMRWNEKLVAHEAPELERLRLGSRFQVTYRMGEGKEPVRVWAEVATWRPPTEVELRYEDDEATLRPLGRSVGPGRGSSGGRGGRAKARWVDGLGRGGWASESMRLEEDGTGTRVERILSVHAPAIPWFFRILFGLLFRFGTPVDRTMLEELKALAEGEGG